jgi:uncharacterized protein (DUF488 family)
MAPLPVVSIGYEGRTPDELISLLCAHHVRRVVDVRELPLSRRKGFSKTPLAAALRSAGIEYEHLRLAGNPHRQLKADTARCLALYVAHLEAHPEVVQLVSSALHDEQGVAVLCFERRHDACHRSCLLAAIDKRSRPLAIIPIE